MKTKLSMLVIGRSLLLIGCYDGHQHGSAYGSSGYIVSPGNAVYPYVYYPDAEVYYQPQPCALLTAFIPKGSPSRKCTVECPTVRHFSLAVGIGCR
jgi:hypothetical protein